MWIRSFLVLLVHPPLEWLQLCGQIPQNSPRVAFRASISPLVCWTNLYKNQWGERKEGGGDIKTSRDELFHYVTQVKQCMRETCQHHPNTTLLLLVCHLPVSISGRGTSIDYGSFLQLTDQNYKGPLNLTETRYRLVSKPVSRVAAKFVLKQGTTASSDIHDWLKCTWTTLYHSVDRNSNIQFYTPEFSDLVTIACQTEILYNHSIMPIYQQLPFHCSIPPTTSISSKLRQIYWVFYLLVRAQTSPCWATQTISQHLLSKLHYCPGDFDLYTHTSALTTLASVSGRQT